MNKKLATEMNKQIQEELSSAYIYLAMSAYFEAKNLKGFANWYYIQAQEEFDHAKGFYNHLFTRAQEVQLLEIPEPKNDYKDIKEVLVTGLEHEKHISARIRLLFDIAEETKDYESRSLLNWYIDEQVEEEESAQDLIDKLEMVGQDGKGLYLLDKELQARSYTPSSILRK